MTSSIKLSTIYIDGLFGVFDYEIPLFTNDRITIMLGQNGLGKTTLLEILNEFFSGNYSELALYPFDRLRLKFTDGTNVEVARRNESQVDPLDNSSENIRVSVSGGPFFEPRVWSTGLISDEAILRVLRLMPPNDAIRPIRNHVAHGGKLTVAMMRELEVRSPRAWTRIVEAGHQEEPGWLVDIRNRFPTTYIPSDRLNPSTLPENDDDGEDRVKRRKEDSVLSYYARVVSRDISHTVDIYADKSQSLDKSFLRRLARRLRQVQFANLSATHIDMAEALASLENSRKSLSELGLLDAESGFDILTPQELQAVPVPVVELHVADNIEKLDVFSNLARRVELLYRISRQRLKFKRLGIDKSEGLVVNALNPKDHSYTKRLKLSDLSSGEQHHLVLLTKLLFDVRGNSLVMIDEPEISMHVVWQFELLRDLQSIASHIDADLLVATHSSQIIGEYLDQTVPLDEQVHLHD